MRAQTEGPGPGGAGGPSSGWMKPRYTRETSASAPGLSVTVVLRTIDTWEGTHRLRPPVGPLPPDRDPHDSCPEMGDPAERGWGVMGGSRGKEGTGGPHREVRKGCKDPLVQSGDPQGGQGELGTPPGGCRDSTDGQRAPGPAPSWAEGPSGWAGELRMPGAGGPLGGLGGRWDPLGGSEVDLGWVGGTGRVMDGILWGGWVTSRVGW